MPTMNGLILPAGRCLVEADSDTTGILRRVSDQGFRRLCAGAPIPENSDPQGPVTPYTRVLFVKENAAEVEIDDATYMAMHQDSIVGVVPD